MQYVARNFVELTARESGTVMKLSLFVLMVTVKGNFLGEGSRKEIARKYNELRKASEMIRIYTDDLKRRDSSDTRRRLSNWNFRKLSLEYQLKNITLKGVI